MKATLEKVSSVKQSVSVEVPIDQIEKSRKTALANIGKDLKLAGFRKGKIPLDVIEKKLGSEAEREIVLQAVRDTYPEAIRQTNANPISEPRVEVLTFEKGKPLSYKATFEIFPDVTVEKYTGLKLEREKVEVFEKEIEQELEHLKVRMTQLEPAEDGTLMEGMMALIDFEGTAEGKLFEGSKTQDFVVDFGSGGLLKEFEAAVHGMKVGEGRRISFTYPEDYFNKEIAGKKGEFDVKIKELRRKIVPKLDDEFAKSLQLENMQDLRVTLKKRIEEAKGELQRRQLHRQVIEQLVKAYPIEVPEVMISSELKAMLEQLNQQLQARGQSLDDAGVTAEEFVKRNRDEAVLRTRGFLLVNAIAHQEKMAVTDEEVENRIKVIAAQSGEPESKMRSHLEQNHLMGQLKGEVLIEKSLDLVVQKAKIKTTKLKKEKK